MPFGGQATPLVESCHQYNCSLTCIKCGDKLPSKQGNSRLTFREIPDTNPLNDSLKPVFIANSKKAKNLFANEFGIDWELKIFSPYRHYESSIFLITLTNVIIFTMFLFHSQKMSCELDF